MRELLLLRHGTTEMNERRLFTGARDVPLSENGRLALLPLQAACPPACLFFTSGMLRARQTLEILYGKVLSIEVPDLGEYRFGDFEGRGHDDLLSTEPIYRQWLMRDGLDVVCPGGESRRAFDARVVRGWKTVASNAWEGVAALICHGGVIRSVLRHFARCMEEETPQNGHGWQLKLEEDGSIVRAAAFPEQIDEAVR